jgi:hypothetical protein
MLTRCLISLLSAAVDIIQHIGTKVNKATIKKNAQVEKKQHLPSIQISKLYWHAVEARQARQVYSSE